MRQTGKERDGPVAVVESGGASKPRPVHRWHPLAFRLRTKARAQRP